ncbi:MAG: ATP-binding cassette domain-containing protein [Nocardioides sp.]
MDTSSPLASEPTQPGGWGATPAIRLSGVTRTFGDVVAVDDLDLTVRPGEVIAFLGPNGAGKTTTVDMVLGLSRPTRGEVQVLGLEPRDAIARGLVSAVMQSGGLLKDLTVRETVRLTASLFPGAADPEDALERAGIARLADRKVGKCSGVSSSDSASRWHCCPTLPCCSSTNRRPAWTSRVDAASGRRSAQTPSGAAPCCSRPTIWRRPTSTPTGSC